MNLDIKAPQGSDTVTFNTVVLDSVPAPIQAGRQ
jgi:hypothetical protein